MYIFPMYEALSLPILITRQCWKG